MAELARLQCEFDGKKNKLAIEYAKSNSSVEIGDVVTDHIGSVRVDKIKVTQSTLRGLPSCTYDGVVLKKDMTPVKRGERRRVWQSNVKAHQS